MKHKTEPSTVIAGLTRKSRFDDAKRVNPLGDRDSLPRRGWRMLLRHDGRSVRFVFPSLI